MGSILPHKITVPFPTSSSSCVSNYLSSPTWSYGTRLVRSELEPKEWKRTSSSRRFNVSCIGSSSQGFGSSSSPYDVLGVDPSCSLADIKIAFRAKVKVFHPDVCKDAENSDAKIRQVIQAYEKLVQFHETDTTERESLDPFEEPECEASHLFVNEAYCIGKGCPHSCVERAPYAFSYNTLYGTARATSQLHSGDCQVQLAVGECPKSCIHYVTPLQRIILEELLESVLNSLLNTAEVATLDSLIVKAKFENNRYQKPREKKDSVSTQQVDWF